MYAAAVSTLFAARVSELAADRCVIELRVVHPDAGPVKDDLVFAIRLLAETAADDDTVLGPLGEDVRFGEAESTAWCEANASRYIVSARLVDTPAPGDGNWRYQKGAIARYEIRVTEPRWLEHLSLEQTWDSAVYS